MEEKETTSTDQSGSDFYLPGMPRPRAVPGRVERFARRLLRQRGTYRFRITRKGQ
ncbi:MAG: hypothetical protein V5A39_07275 [Haloarculaceae archaeon]